MFNGVVGMQSHKGQDEAAHLTLISDCILDTQCGNSIHVVVVDGAVLHIL